jgi:hypothetical protein
MLFCDERPRGTILKRPLQKPNVRIREASHQKSMMFEGLAVMIAAMEDVTSV